ncbi:MULTISPECIES: TlpA disulfide reductase family protein [Massilia]|jgi:thiol-disulfide isomerase/thioredoxin|uniref:TlpA disulfide reductase family protein n=1 Tax=Massilia TaxID=149698 RepID=UPI00040E5E09|nr:MULTISPECIES: TlpA disulfide reductase family protein [Massilia]
MTVTLGPLALPAQLLVAFATIILGSAIGNRVAARRGVKAESSLWLIIAGAILVARIVFVARYWPLYAEEPWRLPDLRDGGLAPVAGFAAAVIIGAILAWRKADQRAAIVIAVWSGLFIWIAGNGLVRMATERQALPEVMLTDLDGRAVPLTAFAGKPMVVNLWASWCPPCRREMPALGKAQREASDLTFVFVNQGEDNAKVRAYLKAEGLPLRNVVLDPGGALAKAAGAPGLPTTLFVDANGILVDKRMGEVSSATLAEHLAVLRSKR